VGIGSFPAVKWLVCGISHPPPSSTEVKESIELYVYSPCVFIAGYRVNFLFKDGFFTAIDKCSVKQVR